MGVLATRTQLTVCGSNTPGNPSIYSAPYGDVEAYTDYRDLYLRCLVNPFLSGKSAYNLPIVYNYPPLFLYLISRLCTPELHLVFSDSARFLRRADSHSALPDPERFPVSRKLQNRVCYLPVLDFQSNQSVLQ